MDGQAGGRHLCLLAARFVSGAGGLRIGPLLAGIKMKEMYEEGSGAGSLTGQAA